METEDLLNLLPDVVRVEIVGESPPVFLIEGEVDVVLASLTLLFSDSLQYERISSEMLRVWFE